MAIKKIIGSSLVAVSMSSVCLVAYAGPDLTIDNNTSKYSSSQINDGLCSSALDGGVIQPYEKGHVVSGVLIAFACWGHESDCKADVYMTDNCNQGGASKVATVRFDTQKGIIPPIQNYTPEYTISGSGFNVALDGGGPAFADKK